MDFDEIGDMIARIERIGHPTGREVYSNKPTFDRVLQAAQSEGWKTVGMPGVAGFGIGLGAIPFYLDDDLPTGRIEVRSDGRVKDALELDDLPVGSVVVDYLARGWVRLRDEGRAGWVRLGRHGRPVNEEELSTPWWVLNKDLPATIIYRAKP